ncbi:MAG: T9SS type A sorting domain-containing protein [Dysgonamonadaceae bacterium]|nr:T9SS type A sorting domain-containing protein [Dysgonamonadaceae bacterium]
MKKIFIFCFVLFACFSYVRADGEFTVGYSSYIVINGMSPDGKYLSGRISNATPFIFSKEDGVQHLPGPGICAYDVSNNGVAVGMYRIGEKDYPGMYKNGVWYNLSADPPYTDDADYPVWAQGAATSISGDGTIIGGMSVSDEWKKITHIEPRLWRVNGNNITRETLESINPDLPYVYGSLWCGGDGEVFGGWQQTVNGQQHSCLWLKGGQQKFFTSPSGRAIKGGIFHISPLGKYAIIYDNEADMTAIYDVDNDRLSPWYSLFFSAMSDNGIAVGTGPDGAIVFSEKTGVTNLWSYLAKAGVQCPDDLSESDLYMQEISSDGLTIGGTVYGDGGVFLLKMDHIPHIVNAVTKVSAKEIALGMISVSWEKPETPQGDVLKGYNIYRNGQKINSSLIAATVSTYTDTGLQNGHYTYSVKAVWNNNNEESGVSNTAEANTALVDLPFYDDFSSGPDAHFWTASADGWRYNSEDGIPAGSMRLDIQLQNVSSYSYEITTPHIRIGNAENVLLTYNLYIPDGKSSHKLYVEMFDGSTWTQLKTHEAFRQEEHGFEWHKIQLPKDKIVGKEYLRIRFRAAGNEEADLYWLFDNVVISTEIWTVEAPADVSAYYDKDADRVYLNWSDPNGYVKLSYLDEDDYGYDRNRIGNEGVPFTAAVRYSAADLHNFSGYTLTSISAFLLHDAGLRNPSYQLVVYKGKQQVHIQNIDVDRYGEWSTFELDKPVVIESGDDYYFGIKVRIHAAGDFPIGLSYGHYLLDENDYITGLVHDGKCNLVSEDDGDSWYSIRDNHGGMSFNEILMITAELKKNPATPRRKWVLGYEVTRDGQSIYESGDIDVNMIFDSEPNINSSHPESCYRVIVHYISIESKSSDPICLNATGITPVVIDAVRSYPNPASDLLYIEGEYIQARLLNMNGQVVKTVHDSYVSVKDIPAGVYVLEIVTFDGVKKEKVIVE